MKLLSVAVTIGIFATMVFVAIRLNCDEAKQDNTLGNR